MRCFLGIYIFFSFFSFFYFFFKAFSNKSFSLSVPVFYSFLLVWFFLFFSDFYPTVYGYDFSEYDYKRFVSITLVAAWSFYFGSILVKKKKSFGDRFIDKASARFVGIPSWLVFVVFVVWLIVLHLAFPPEHLYSRSGYSTGGVGSQVFRKVYPLLIVILSFLLPFFRVVWLRGLLLVVMVLLVQGLNQRVIILIPVLYLLGVYVRDRKVSPYKFAFSIFSVIYLAAFALKYRSFGSQGVFPNFLNFISDPVSLKDIFLGLEYIFSFSIFSTMATLSQESIGLNSLFLHLNPLPSFLVDVSEIVYEQKITTHGPYSALGTIGMFGFFGVLCYYFICGFLFSYSIESFSERYKVFSIFCVVFLVVFVVLSTQYPLRTITRVLYYSLFIYFFFKMVSMLRVALYRRN